MSENTNSTSLSLLDLVKAKDSDAWGRFVGIYTPLVMHWCMKKAHMSQEDAADVTQDVFLSASKAIGEFRRDRTGDSLRGWLRVITQNKIRNTIRQQKKHPRSVGGTTAAMQLQAFPEDVLLEDEEVESSIIMRRAVDLMHGEFFETTYRAFWMSAIDGLDTDLIGEQLQMTPQAVRQACYRIRRRLRVELGDDL